MIVVLIALLVTAGAAVAQEPEVIGTIDATLNGEARSWYVLELATDDGPQATASWSSIMGTVLQISVQAHPERRFAITDALAVELSLFSPPEDCPCSYGSDAVSVMYWPSGSMFEDFHLSGDGGTAEATVETFEEIDDGVYRLEGTFAAEMPLMPGIGQEPDMTQVATIDGRFMVERLPESDVEMP